MGRLYNYLKGIYVFFRKHWFINALIITIPSVWFSFFIGVLGHSFGLKDRNNHITTLGVILSIIVVCGILLFNLLKSSVDYSFNARLESSLSYTSRLLESDSCICDERKQSLLDTLQSVYERKMDLPIIVTNPRRQLKKIVAEMKTALCDLTGKKNYEFKQMDFNISLAYTFPLKGENWYWLRGLSQPGKDVNDLVHNPDSTLAYLLRTKETYYFNNRKEDAEIEHAYVLNDNDKTNRRNGQGMGSIFCIPYVIKKEGVVYVRAFLTITTKNMTFVKNTKDDVAKKNVSKHLYKLCTSYFGLKIESELCLFSLEKW